LGHSAEEIVRLQEAPKWHSNHDEETNRLLLAQ